MNAAVGPAPHPGGARAMLEKAVFAVVVGTIAIAPVPLGSNRAWAWAALSACTAAALATWLLLWATGGVAVSRPLRKSWPVFALLAVWIANLAVSIVPLPVDWVRMASPHSAALQAQLAVVGIIPQRMTLSIEPYATRALLLKSSMYVAIFFLLLAVVNTRARLLTAVRVLVFAAVAHSLYAIAMHLLRIDQEYLGTRIVHRIAATGFYPNQNHFAGMLEMVLALAIGLLMAGIARHPARTWKEAFVQAWGRGASLPVRIALCVLVVALCATHSRAGNVAFAVSLLSIAILSVWRSPGSARALFVLFASIVLIDVVLVGGFFGAEKLAERIQSTSLQDVEDRHAAARTALQIIRDFPIFGSGGGTFYVAFPAYRTPSIRNFYEYAHNDYAQTFAECGVIGFCSIGLAILVTLAAAWRAQWRRAEGLMIAMSSASLLGCGALLVHSWADFNLQITANAILFVFLGSVGWVSLHLPDPDDASSAAALNDT